MLLATAGCVALVVPLIFGLLHAARVYAQSQTGIFTQAQTTSIRRGTDREIMQPFAHFHRLE